MRVTQGKEPAFFRELFNGRMVVHTGGVASGWKNKVRGDAYANYWMTRLTVHE
jgi:hypothetical protein